MPLTKVKAVGIENPGKVLQVSTVSSSTDTTLSAANYQITQSSPSSTEGYQMLTMSVTPLSSTSKFIAHGKVSMSEATNTDNGTYAFIFADTTRIAEIGTGWFVYNHGYSLPDQTPNADLLGVYSGSHTAGTAVTFQVRIGNNGSGTGAIRINNVSSLPVGFSSMNFHSNLVVYEIEA